MVDEIHRPLTRSFEVGELMAELAAMKIILETLDVLSPAEQIRIINYVRVRIADGH